MPLPTRIRFQAIAEDLPGRKWQALCEQAWP